jgi:phospholipid-binding lipoprotein MlaA
MNNAFRLLLALTFGLTAAQAQAQSATSPAHEQSALDADPLSGFNHAMYQFNYVFDGVALKPAAHIYRGLVPEYGRARVTNALENIYLPVTFGNSLLQGDVYNSFTTLWRFLINSTIGLAGMYDVASDAGLHHRATDLGQTFAIYGAEPGAYLVLPILGPSSVRDGIGRVGDIFMNPLVYIDSGLSYAVAGATAVDARANNMKLIDDIYASSLDPYSTFKSGHTQKRASDVRRAKEDRRKSLEKAGFQ